MPTKSHGKPVQMCPRMNSSATQKTVYARMDAACRQSLTVYSKPAPACDAASCSFRRQFHQLVKIYHVIGKRAQTIARSHPAPNPTSLSQWSAVQKCTYPKRKPTKMRLLQRRGVGTTNNGMNATHASQCSFSGGNAALNSSPDDIAATRRNNLKLSFVAQGVRCPLSLDFIFYSFALLSVSSCFLSFSTSSGVDLM